MGVHARPADAIAGDTRRQLGDPLPDHWQVARQAQTTNQAVRAPGTTTHSAESAWPGALFLQ
jgi:hypothetical protein